jgi:glycosyltransferase involved in cell wall biosynthesis
MHSQDTIAIACPFGNPRLSKTWSGTPANLINALEKQGIKVIGINSKPSKIKQAIALVLQTLSGFGTFEFGRGKYSRSYRAKIVRSQAEGCQKILHMGTWNLPMPAKNFDFEHYLFCDTTWNLWFRDVTNIDRYKPKLIQSLEQLETAAYSQIEHFFSTSEYVRDNLIEHYNIDRHKITVVGTGRGKIEPFQGNKDYQNGPILFVAKERFQDKGGFLLLEAFRLVQQQNPALKLVIVGSEEYQQFVRDIPNIRVTGFIPSKELQHLFDTASLFAMPSLHEPWGLVYLEALASKTPILGLNRNSLPEITQNGKFGFLVDRPDPQLIAKSILQAFSDPDKLCQMGKEGQKYCLETFSWEQVAIKINSIMNKKKSTILR